MRNGQILVLHLRGTRGDPFGVYDDFLSIASAYLARTTRLHIHSFTGSTEFLNQLQREGFAYFLLGVNSLAVHDQLHTKTQEAIYDKFQHHVVLESDAPHLSYDSNINYPNSVYLVANHLSGKWRMNIESVVDLTTSAFLQFYHPWRMSVVDFQ